MTVSIDRRTMLALTGSTAAAALVDPQAVLAREVHLLRRGVVVGQPHAALAGQQVLADGGNAVDAIVAAGLAAGVTALSATGIGGYGGHMTVALVGRPVRVIDLNSTAPAAARDDMFDAAEDGSVPGRVNEIGWLSAGVPGALGGMQLAADVFGTRSMRELLAPAIRLAEEGFLLTQGDVGSIARSLQFLRGDEGSRDLLLTDGGPPMAGTLFRNPDLAAMLQTLANDNSVESFYRGSIARRIARAFAVNGGLVTEQDLAAYEARVVEPLTLDWMGLTVHTAPLTAGGATVIEALRILQAMDSSGAYLESPHARLESLRVAWQDRLEFLGDPQHSDVPLEHLLSDSYAQSRASEVALALERGAALDISTPSRDQNGTIHLSAVDEDGHMAALTFTHGGGFGSKMTVPGLGLILGHGVSRFDPRPNHPNSPGPGKRPLHNMCPTIVSRGGRPLMAVGGRGGRRIPNAVFDVLVGVLRGYSLEKAVAAPRMLTDRNPVVTLEATWPDGQVEAFESMGYEIRRGSSARISAAGLDPETGAFTTAER